MSEREVLLKKIIDEFSILENKIDKHNNLNLTDINLFSEDFFSKILNIIFRYNLKPFKKNNYPAIDLGDKENSIAFQITSTNAKGKIQKTLNGFKDQNLNLEFFKLKILILSRKQKIYKNLKIDETINFNPSTDIMDINDLLKDVKELPIQKMQKILELFTRRVP
ncbi:SMEK domain-containing protein [Salinimicrobium sp. WS361]|uniref:SMEK domain-containing protein n=1 Tax=Salinimicrobium sp. WS361 TaxID=3425123 RepID=UPI003D6FBCAA